MVEMCSLHNLRVSARTHRRLGLELGLGSDFLNGDTNYGFVGIAILRKGNTSECRGVAGPERASLGLNAAMYLAGI